jgi:hypothetical protein
MQSSNHLHDLRNPSAARMEPYPDHFITEI